MAEKLNLQPLSGMAEWTPGLQAEFERWKQVVAATYSEFGFQTIATPALERREILQAKVGVETQKQIYTLERGGHELGLRFDLTVPLARYVAAHQNELTFPFRRQVIAPVWRGERAQKFRFREFYQADADIIGRGSLASAYDAEIIQVAMTAIERLNLGKFQVQINNRKIVMGFLKAMKVMDEQKVIGLLDDATKIGENKLKEELKLLRLDGFEVRQIMQFIKIAGDWHTYSQGILNLKVESQLIDVGLEELHQLEQHLTAAGVDKSHYAYNTGIIRGLDYYTGLIFETVLPDYPQVGSVGGGGRYDNLTSKFATTKMPGVGASLGLTRLFAQMVELGVVKANTDEAPVVVVPMTDNWEWVQTIAAALRQSGVLTDIYWQSPAVGKALKYADGLGARWALLLGENELASHLLTLKDLESGQQLQLNLAQVIDTVSEKA